MADGIPQVALGINDAAQSVVIVEGATQVSDLEQLLAAAPGLLHPDAAAVMARAVAHFASGSTYRVIEDPRQFEAAYRARVATEDPDAPWREGVYRLRDHGMPDFAGIAPPAYTGTDLVFFAQSGFLGLPYRVEIDVADPGKVDGGIFHALSLTPFPPSTASQQVDPEFVGALGVPDNSLSDPDSIVDTAPAP